MAIAPAAFTRSRNPRVLHDIVFAALASISLLAACSGPRNAPTAPTTSTSSSCSFTVTPDSTSKTLTATAGTFSVAVSTSGGCSWTAVANDAFLSVTSGATGAGSGTVQVGVSANAGADRTGSLTVAGTTVTVTQPGTVPATCAFSVTPTSASISASGGDLTFTVTVTQGAGCSWTAATNDPFLSVKSGSTGSGNGTVVLTAGANAGGNRSASATIAGQTIAISQLAAGCAFNVAASPTSVPAGGGDVALSISMTQGAACAWTVASTDPFVTVKSGASGTGNGSAVVTLAANTGGNRSASISAAGQTVVISQAAAAVACAFAITAAPASVPASGGDVQLRVANTQGLGCAWTATTASAFVTIVSGATGTGSGTAIARFTANTGPARSATITVAGQTIVVAQDAAAAACVFTISPGNQNVGAAGQSFTEIISVLGSGCTWTASTTATFLTVSPASGTGNSGVTITVAANTDAARSGLITIAGQTFTIAQADGRGVVILSYQSQQGDFIGLGQTQTRTVSTSVMRAITVNATHSEIDLSSPVSSGQFWSLNFATIAGGTLSPGFFDDTARFPFQSIFQPGLDFALDGRGCNRSLGRFLIGEATFSGTTIQRFHAVFEQHCEYASAWVRGDIWIDAAGSTSVPPLALPAAPSTPTTFFSAQSTAGDPVGQGHSVSYTLGTMVVTPTFDPTRQYVSVNVTAPDGFTFIWHLNFQAPAGQTLAPGTYLNAGLWPFQSSSAPGLSVSNGISCGNIPGITGQFTVLEIQYDSSNAIQRFHATFQQTCNGATGSLTGEIYVVANPWR